eukprot:763778-Hanusia_phi.AAC.19
MSILVLLGLLGLSPYLYLFWAATHGLFSSSSLRLRRLCSLVSAAPLGSWGDTSTLSGWPAVGFWTHFLRKEYGTFALYSGKESSSGINQLSFSIRTIFCLALLFHILLVSSASSSSFTHTCISLLPLLVVSGMLVPSSAPSSEHPLLFQSHFSSACMFASGCSRTWSRPVLSCQPLSCFQIVFAFLGMGCDKIFSQLASSRRFIVIFFTLAAIAAQLGINWEKVDQSDNWYTYDFGKALLDPRPEHAVLLTQGDVVTNSVRYHQEDERGKEATGLTPS